MLDVTSKARDLSGLTNHVGTKTSAKGVAFGALALVIVSAVIGFALIWGGELSIQQFVDILRSWGMWGVLGSVGLMIVDLHRNLTQVLHRKLIHQKHGCSLPRLELVQK